jgi:hypothetical protein
MQSKKNEQTVVNYRFSAAIKLNLAEACLDRAEMIRRVIYDGNIKPGCCKEYHDEMARADQYQREAEEEQYLAKQLLATVPLLTLCKDAPTRASLQGRDVLRLRPVATSQGAGPVSYPLTIPTLNWPIGTAEEEL